MKNSCLMHRASRAIDVCEIAAAEAISETHRVLWAGRDLKNHLLPPPAMAWNAFP